jgi:hypothetical protein
MKRFWPRILSAFSTLTVGLAAASIVRLLPPTAVKVPPLYAQRTKLIGEMTRPHPVALSPYEARRIISTDLQSLCRRGDYWLMNYGLVWEELNLKISDEGGAGPDPCSGKAKTSLYFLELDTDPGSEALLQIDFREPYATVYLVFKQERHGAGWTLLGPLSYLYGLPFLPASFRVSSTPTRRWLIIKAPSAHGPGFGRVAEDWYEVSANGLKKVLSYQTSLYIGQRNPSLESETKYLELDYRDGVATLVLETSTEYRSYGTPNHVPSLLWTSKWRTAYIKGPGMQSFVLDPFNSGMAEGFNPLAEGDAYPGGDFLKYNYLELLKLAADGNRKQKQWLRDFLDTRDESLEKQSLLTALGGEQP